MLHLPTSGSCLSAGTFLFCELPGDPAALITQRALYVNTEKIPENLMGEFYQDINRELFQQVHHCILHRILG